jgi:hypothetical protein
VAIRRCPIVQIQHAFPRQIKRAEETAADSQ